MLIFVKIEEMKRNSFIYINLKFFFKLIAELFDFIFIDAMVSY